MFVAYRLKKVATLQQRLYIKDLNKFTNEDCDTDLSYLKF
ncbi:hypothetical protein bthur0013_57390 [Bacillus thuringiensis IBL 200]|nr:hypothetical protein bthur0013_57390 [Bacillus thuringiensis IBL 200]